MSLLYIGTNKVSSFMHFIFLILEPQSCLPSLFYLLFIIYSLFRTTILVVVNHSFYFTLFKLQPTFSHSLVNPPQVNSNLCQQTNYLSKNEHSNLRIDATILFSPSQFFLNKSIFYYRFIKICFFKI